MPKNPLYIQLEPGAYPQDTDWQIMTAEERGCYHALIIFISCNDGSIAKDPAGLALLCNIEISKLKTFLEKYSHKFIINDGEISHKRVTYELSKARKYIKQKSLAGKKGMKQRYNNVITHLPNTDITKGREVKGSKGKGSKGKNKDTIKEDKIKHLEFVMLTPTEHKKLVAKFGAIAATTKIEALNEGIGSKGYKYKSHYYTILSWDRKNNPAPKKPEPPKIDEDIRQWEQREGEFIRTGDIEHVSKELADKLKNPKYRAWAESQRPELKEGI